MGLKGLEGFEALLVANQQARVTAGTTDEAGNNLVNLLSKITAAETKKRLEDFEYKDEKGKTRSINYLKSMEAYKAQGKNSLEAFMAIMDKVVGNNDDYKALQEKLKTAKGEEQKKLFDEMTNLVEGSAIGGIISDRQALMALLAIRNNIELGKVVTQGIQKSDGSMDTSYQVVAASNDFKVEKAKAQFEFAQMESLNGFNNMLGQTSEALSDYMKQYPDLTTAIAGAGTGIAALGAAAITAAGSITLLGGSRGGLSDAVGSSRGRGITGSGKFGNVMKWGSRAVGVLGVTTMLSGSEDKTTQNRKRETSLALNAVKTGNATAEQERLVYELNKASVEKYDKGNWFTRLTMSDSGVTQARRMVEQYEAKQADGNLANVASQVAGQLSVLASQTGRLNPNVAHRTKSQPSNKQADIRQKAETNRVLSTVKSNNAPIENEPANEPKAFSVPEWKKGNERVNASDSGGEQARRVLRGNGVKPTQGVAVAEVASQISVLASQQASTKGQVDSVNSVLAHYQADFAAFGQTILEGLQAGLAAQSHTIDNRITVELDGAVIAQKVSQQQFQFFKRG